MSGCSTFNLPCTGSERKQRKSFSNFIWFQRSRQVLLVCEHQQRNTFQLCLLQGRAQGLLVLVLSPISSTWAVFARSHLQNEVKFVCRFLQPFLIKRIYHIHQCICAVKVIPPVQQPNWIGALQANVPFALPFNRTGSLRSLLTDLDKEKRHTTKA